MQRDHPMLDPDEIPSFIRYRPRTEFEELMILVIRQAAQDAAGTSTRCRRTDKVAAQWWFRSPAENGWEITPEAPGYLFDNGIMYRLVNIKGVSFRWVCIQFGLDPDIIQKQVLRLGWERWNRQAQKMAFDWPTRPDPRRVGARVARSAEKRATAIVEAL